MRGLAALSVVLAHSDASIGGNHDLPFSRWHGFSLPGTAGVEFFFVLSGFVMAASHGGEIGQGGDAGRFLWKRFCRIYPLYWLVLAIPLYRFWGAPVVTPEAVVAWFSLLPVRFDNLVVVAWTLRQEVTFYLLFALCLLPRAGRAVLAAWIGGTLAWWLWRPALPFGGGAATVVAHVFNPFNFEFFAGLLAGWLLPRATIPPWAACALLPLALLAILWRMSLDGWGAAYGPAAAQVVYGAGYAAIILALASLERDGVLRFQPRAARLALAAGAVSYPLYLTHLTTLDAVAGIIGPLGLAARIGPDATFALLVAAAAAMAWLVTAFIDQPIQQALRRVSAGSMLRRPVAG